MKKGLKSQVRNLVDEYTVNGFYPTIYEDTYRNGDKRYKFVGLKVDPYTLDDMQEMCGKEITDTKGNVWEVVAVYRDKDYIKNLKTCTGAPFDEPLCVRIRKKEASAPLEEERRSKQNYKVAVKYLVIVPINAKACSRKEAIEKAELEVSEMTESELLNQADWDLQDSEIW